MICLTYGFETQAALAPSPIRNMAVGDAHLPLGAPRQKDHGGGLYPCEGLDPTLNFGVKLPVLEEGRRHGKIYPEPRGLTPLGLGRCCLLPGSRRSDFGFLQAVGRTGRPVADDQYVSLAEEAIHSLDQSTRAPQGSLNNLSLPCWLEVLFVNSARLPLSNSHPSRRSIPVTPRTPRTPRTARTARTVCCQVDHDLAVFVCHSQELVQLRQNF